MDIKGFVKNHEKKIIAVGTVIIISVVSIVSGSNPMAVLQCLLSTDPASVACQTLQAPDTLSAASVITPQ